MGNRIEAMAVFDAISVNVDARRHMRNKMANGGKVDKPERWFPMECDSPDTLDASEIT